MPDGRVARFEVPEGTTPEQAQSMMEEHFSAPTAAPKPDAKPEVPGVGQTLAIAAGRTFDKIGDGLTQAYLAARGEKSALGGLQKNVAEKDELYKPLEAARPMATTIGGALPYMAVPVGAGATALGTVGRLAASGAASGALEYGSVEDRAKKAATGAALSVAGGYLVPKTLGLVKTGAGKMARKVAGGVSPETRALFDAAQKQGIPVNAAQLSDSKPLKVLASVAEKLPLSGAGKARDAQQAAFNRAVSRTFGAESDKVTSDVYSMAKGRLGAEFERLSANNAVKVSDELLGKLSAIQDEAARFGTDDSARAVGNVIDELLGKVDQAGTLPGRTYQSLDSQLGKLTKAGGEKAHFLGQIRETMRGAMDESISAGDKAAWQTAREQYKALKTVRDLVAKSPEGDISPALLMGRVNASQAGKEAMASGRGGKLGELARIGQRFIKDPVPDSGTAQRWGTLMALASPASIAGPLGYAGAMGTLLGAGRLTTTAINSPTVTRGLLESGPSFAEVLAANQGLLSLNAGRNTGLLVAQERKRR